jgi:cell wall-associated NlpC family hydrolase
VTDAATPRADPRALADALGEFTASNSGRGLDAVDLRVEERDGAPLINGKVLTFKQAHGLEELARRHGAGLQIKVIADPRSGLEQGWVEPTVEVLDVWRDPARAGEEMGRQNQYLAGADGPLRRLHQEGEFLLVQGIDLAVGWAAAADLREADPEASRTSWEDVERATEQAARQAARDDASTAAVLQRARAELAVPYLWGGTTHHGFDCSGLILRVIRDATGVLLPRHSGDQRRVGERIVTGQARASDLLFARPREQRVGHVLLMTSESTVLHACRTEHRVIEEELDDNARRYQHQGWRRPVLLDG